jgi:hypothetical protein
MPDKITVRIHATPCGDKYAVDNLHGGPSQPIMPIGALGKVLREAITLRESGCEVVVRILDEPTTHPDFVQVQERLLGGGLCGAPCFLTSNGEGLVQCPEEHIRRLKQTGMAGINLRWYGDETTHDWFVGRKGAFNIQMDAAWRMIEHQFEVTSTLYAHRNNCSQLVEFRNKLMEMLPGEQAVGLALPGSVGRAAKPEMRPLDIIESLDCANEQTWVERIKESKELGDTRLGEVDAGIYMDVYGDLSVFASPPQSLPYPFLPKLRVGKIKETPLAEMAQACRENEVIKAWAAATYMELATQVDIPGEEIYTLQDITQNRWALPHLAMLFDINQSAL